jgi:molecular chaperone HscA
LCLVDHTSSMPKVTFGTTKYSFPELAAKIFLFLKEHAEQELGTAISKAVVSVPAYFDDASRGGGYASC